jgi:hypothetical protein
MRVLGVDCAGVILNPCIGSVPGAFDSLREIVRSGQFEKIYIVSQVNPLGRIAFSHRLWLRGLWKYTGIPRSNLYFCRYRSEKSIFCKKLGITDFIDDTPEVLSYLGDVDRLYALNIKKINQADKYQLPKNVAFFSSWKELLPQLLATSSAAPKE